MSYLILVSLIGLMVGSFLNVVIYRIPIIMHKGTQIRSAGFAETPFSLASPPSHCPHCQQKIHYRHNIPLISYLLLKGRCYHCRGKISIAYPATELITLLLTFYTFYDFGFTLIAAVISLWIWNLIALGIIDLKNFLLPDNMTLPFLWLGLFFNCFCLLTTSAQAVEGVIFGYLSLWLVATFFKWWTKKQGMGHGDFKMLAMIGAWLGFPAVINVLFIAVFSALLTSLCLLATGKMDREEPIPFGTFLAISAGLMIFYGPYFNVMSL